MLLVATIVPLIKNKLGNTEPSDNYRSLALSSVILKIYDWVVITLFGDRLNLDELQFSYQKNISINMCSWLVVESIGHFRRNNSDVFSCFMDMSKAFDMVRHFQETNIPHNAVEKYSKHPSIIKIKDNYPQNTTFSFKPVNLEVIQKLVKSLDVSKSSPIESVPARILKDISDVLCPKLVIDFNSSISTGIFPENMKLADVVPLYKKNARQDKGNYRPVSLLSALSKVFGRTMHSQMHDYMKNKLSIFLCGFQELTNECPKLPYISS